MAFNEYFYVGLEKLKKKKDEQKTTKNKIKPLHTLTFIHYAQRRTQPFIRCGFVLMNGNFHKRKGRKATLWRIKRNKKT